MSLEILKFPHPFLRKKAVPVTKVNQKIRNLLEAMFQTMKEHLGLGLAAIQVGRLEKVFVAGGDSHKIALVNPELIEKSSLEIMDEGCLSLPGIYLPIERAARVKVAGLNLQGKKVIIEETGLLARAFQQELDHLEGILIIDRVPVTVLKEELEKLEKNIVQEQNKIEPILIAAIRREKGI
jgi:peptide deformylase